MLRSSKLLQKAAKLSKSLYQKRTLYAPATLGIDSYELTRQRIKGQFAENETKFKSKMKEYLETKPDQMVFTEDLKTMVHIADSKEDVELVIKMMKKYHMQSKELKYGNFVFGPVIYRMFYYLKDVDAALDSFEDSELRNGFFNQIITYQILMDMLYENKRYQEGLNVFDIVRSLLNENDKLPKHSVLLAIACCYKLNTPESFKYCTNLWQDLMNSNNLPMRKAATFAAALALTQKCPHIALEILSTVKDQHYVTVKNIKVIAYADSGRSDTAVGILRTAIDVDEPIAKNRTFLKDTLQIVENSIQNIKDAILLEDFKKIERILYENNQVTDKTLDDILSNEIMFTSFNNKNFEGKNKAFVASSFAKRNQKEYRSFNRVSIRANQED